MTVVVTGGSGFIGSCLVGYLNQQGVDDIIIVDRPRESPKWKNLLGKRFADYIHVDDFLARLSTNSLPKIDAFFHLGASSATTVTDGCYLLANNFAYSKACAIFARRVGARFIFASSAATYGDGSAGFSDDLPSPACRPLNPYGFSKLLFDQWADREGILASCGVGLRFFNVYGPNEYHKGEQASVPYKACAQIRSEGSIKLFASERPDFKDGEQRRDFVFVLDCVRVMWWLFKNRHVTGILNVGTGQSRTWNDMARAIFTSLGKEPSISYIPMPANISKHYQYVTEADVTKLRAAGYSEPWTPLEDGIREYITRYLLPEESYY